MTTMPKINSINSVLRTIAIVSCAATLAACSGAGEEAQDTRDLGEATLSHEDVKAIAFAPSKACLENERLLALSVLSSSEAKVRARLILRALTFPSIVDERATLYRQAADFYLRSNDRKAKSIAFALYVMASNFGDHLVEESLKKLSASMSKDDAFAAPGLVAAYFDTIEMLPCRVDAERNNPTGWPVAGPMPAIKKE